MKKDLKVRFAARSRIRLECKKLAALLFMSDLSTSIDDFVALHAIHLWTAAR